MCASLQLRCRACRVATAVTKPVPGCDGAAGTEPETMLLYQRPDAMLPRGDLGPTIFEEGTVPGEWPQKCSAAVTVAGFENERSDSGFRKSEGCTSAREACADDDNALIQCASEWTRVNPTSSGTRPCRTHGSTLRSHHPSLHRQRQATRVPGLVAESRKPRKRSRLQLSHVGKAACFTRPV